ncbi:hypothetical protein F7734_15395 [Scytonema sp. UIC 10036]|uniref:hypothetical protein n=1 Tax=Scytonema sp. UIC 10036 TaxID=2304196 RepID=UPI0012DA52EF|nr:hypothetical protein [Scytonema sp. UIC 10036]MUG93727.1 hypothetical protein [Scytonema sp. UIC 10036]
MAKEMQELWNFGQMVALSLWTTARFSVTYLGVKVKLAISHILHLTVQTQITSKDARKSYLIFLGFY